MKNAIAWFEIPTTQLDQLRSLSRSATIEPSNSRHHPIPESLKSLEENQRVL